MADYQGSRSAAEIDALLCSTPQSLSAIQKTQARNNQGTAPINSPAFTGTPTAPTPTAGDDSGKLATTEFVNDAIAGKADADSLATVATSGSYNDLADTPEPYTLPTATETVLGGVKAVAKTGTMTQHIGVDEDGNLYYNPAAGSGGAAADVTYDNTTSGMVADDVQTAIDDLAAAKIDAKSIMPNITAAMVADDRAVQYLGETGESFTYGHFYHPVSNGETPPAYSWEEIVYGDPNSVSYSEQTKEPEEKAQARTNIGAQESISAYGMLKGDGDGAITTAVPGTDYGAPPLTGMAAPTAATVGVIGQLYIASIDGEIHTYKCLAIVGVEPDISYTWNEEGSGAATNQTVTLAANGWNGSPLTQTVNVSGLLVTDDVDVSPIPSSLEAYYAAGVYASAVAEGSITFTAGRDPLGALTVNVRLGR